MAYLTQYLRTDLHDIIFTEYLHTILTYYTSRTYIAYLHNNLYDVTLA